MKSSPMSGVLPPFELPSGIVYFLDWRYVDHGYLRWLTPENQPVSVMPAPDPLPPMHASSEWLPKGIRIETVPGTVDPEPVLKASELGEKLFFGGSVVKAGSGYRLYYESIRPGDGDPNHSKVLRVAESDNGVEWRFPKGSVRVEGARHDNACFDPGAVGYHGGCVFVDGHAPADERFKSVWMGLVSTEMFEQYRRQWPDDIDPMAVFAAGYAHARPGVVSWGIFGAVSADGYAWRRLDEPLLIQHSDTFNAGTYDPLFDQYVIYPRTWYYGRRAVGRAVSSDFRHFGGLTQVLWPDASMRATDTWYTPGYATVPGAPDYRLLFATLWAQVDDTFTPHLHSSADGILWQRVPGRPMLQQGPTGSWHACGGAIPSFVELPGDTWGSLIMGWHVPHKFPRAFPGFGQTGWVRWTRGRLAALRADEDAEFALYPIKPRGRKLILNYRTRHAGWIRIGVAGKEVRRTAEDCDEIIGDELDRTVTWKGEPDMKAVDDEAVQVKVRMRAADLYSIRFE